MLPRRLSRGGFTMIELMVAIGILIILVGILMFAMRSIGDSAKAAETRATLASLSGMLAEMDAKTKLSQPPIQYWQPGNSTPVDGQVALAADSEVDFWHMPGKDTTGTYPMSIDAPPGSVKSGEQSRTTDKAVQQTAIALSKLLTLPANRAKYQTIQANRLMTIPDDTNPAMKIKYSQYAIPLDGWGNPIIFVPASGLYNVHFSSDQNGAAPHLITSSKMRVPNGNNDRANVRVDRPFFASAGPDGVFGYVDTNLNGSYETATDKPGGDDNIYSFEQ
jgi:type II secretory pathway pseudopilin PulG